MPQTDGITIFVEHGNVLICAGLIAVLRKQGGFNPVECQPDWAVEAGPMLHGTARAVVIADYETGMRHIESATAGWHRIVILTHRDSEAEIGRALECGAQGYLLLDVSPGELVESLKLAHQGGVALAPSVAIRAADRLKQAPLTQREREVLAQMMLGLSNKVVAARLTVSIGTVKTHVKSILEKLQAVSRTQAVTIAQRRGLLGPGLGELRHMPALRGQNLIYGRQVRRGEKRDEVPLLEVPAKVS